jgi:O-acetylserine/cysteine efflux transporter
MTDSRRLVFPALISAGILWGTTVPLSKLALGWLPPAWLALTRFALAAAILMIISRGRLRGAASPAILISGGFGFGASVVLQNFGVERTSVSHAALLIGATPVLVAILAAAFRQGVARPAAWLGFGLSLAGVAVIASGKGGGASLGGDGLVLLAQLGSAGFTVSQPRLLRGRDPLAVTAVQLCAAAVVTLPLALASGGLHASHASSAALLATAGLIVAGTVGPTALFAFGQSHVSADVAGAFLNLEPLVGAITGIVLFADPVGPAQLAGGAAILAGIGLSSVQAVRAERQSRQSAAGRPILALATPPAGTPAGTAHGGVGGQAPSLDVVRAAPAPPRVPARHASALRSASGGPRRSPLGRPGSRVAPLPARRRLRTARLLARRGPRLLARRGRRLVAGRRPRSARPPSRPARPAWRPRPTRPTRRARPTRLARAAWRARAASLLAVGRSAP